MHFSHLECLITAVGTLANSYGIVVLARKLRGEKPKLFNYEKLVKLLLPKAHHYTSLSGYGVYADNKSNLLVYGLDSRAEAWEHAWLQALQEGLITIPGMRRT